MRIALGGAAMLALLGFLTIFVFLVCTFSGRVSVLVALVIVPLIAGLAGGFGADLGKMMLDGILKVTPTGVMIMFAVLYFGLMLGVGIFDPLIRGLVSLVRGDPVRLCLVTAALSMLVALDGDGATTFLITITALLPVHRRMGMNPLVLPGVVALGAGVMNILPWGGPTARTMAVLHADASQIFTPIVPALCVGILWVFLASAIIGLRERRRIGVSNVDISVEITLTKEEQEIRRPKLFWFNVALTLAVLAALFTHIAPLAIIFVVGFAIALIVNYPAWEDQRERLIDHAGSVVTVTSMIFAAGIFTGILGGTKMIEAMSQQIVDLMPDFLTPYLSKIVAVVSMPFSLIFTPDAFYFGVLPVFAGAAGALGQDPLTIGRAAILGQMTTGFPLSPLTASTFILIGLSGVSLGAHQRFIFVWAFATTIIMAAVAWIGGVI
ncbi:CitMHS family transporter [Phyllobacterium myrsinacearum]